MRGTRTGIFLAEEIYLGITVLVARDNPPWQHNLGLNPRVDKPDPNFIKFDELITSLSLTKLSHLTLHDSLMLENEYNHTSSHDH